LVISLPFQSIPSDFMKIQFYTSFFITQHRHRLSLLPKPSIPCYHYSVAYNQGNLGCKQTMRFLLFSIVLIQITISGCLSNTKPDEVNLVVFDNNQDSGNLGNNSDSLEFQAEKIIIKKNEFKSQTWESGARVYYFVNEKGNQHGEYLINYGGGYIGAYGLYFEGIALYHVKCLGEFVLVNENEEFRGKDTSYFTEYDTLFNMIKNSRSKFNIKPEFCFIKNIADFHLKIKKILK